MGLSLCVGILADLQGGDPEGFDYYVEQFASVNAVLESFELPPHEEPVDLEGDLYFSCDMYGYSGLHYLRRLAAHLALKGDLPQPGDEGAADDPVLAQYYDLFDDLYAEGKAAGMRFQHLLVHSDAEGFYLPADFEQVITTDASSEIAGGVIGSAPRLLEECLELARALDLPPELSLEDESVWEAADSQGEGAEKWQRYGVESYTCLALVGACRASAEARAALVFT